MNIKSLTKKLNQKKKVMKDRLKDNNDPVAHPVLFFRRKKDLPHKKIEYLTGLPAGSRLVITDKDGELRDRLDRGSTAYGRASSASVYGRPSSAALANKTAAGQTIAGTQPI